MTSGIRTDAVAPGVTRIVLARPERLNAYSDELCTELATAVRCFDADDTQRVLVITGEGRGFCSGGDLRGDPAEQKRIAARTLGRGRQMRDGFHALALALYRLDKPVVAAINGVAVAGGLALALLCDIRVAAASARLGDTSGKFALLPDEGGAWLFPRAMGYDRALLMVLLSEIYSAEEALRLGLVTEVVPDDRLEERTRELAERLASRSPLAARLAKQLMRRGLEQTLEHSLDDAAMAVEIANAAPDARKAIRAFQERREPVFGGR